MKNKILFSALVSTALVGCMDDSITQTTNVANGDNRISFVQKVGNMTKGTQQAQNAGHYEFGVWAMKGSALADYIATSNGVMGNYLVAYTDGTTTGINNWYQGVKAAASTWGNTPSEDLTDVANGFSSWFYEGITSSNHATYTTPETNQILKYWDLAAANHYFFAYMPYTGTGDATGTYNADKVKFSYYTETSPNPTHGTFEFTNLSSFYTSPVTDKQVATAAAKTDKTYNDTEILNDNEALYAYKAVEKASYGNDVPLEFKHINAKINIAFYEVIKDYKVRLIDVVPSTAVSLNSNLTAAPGVQFSPSTDNQGRQPMTVKQTDDLPTYYEAAEVTASHVEDGNATLAVKGTTLASPKTKVDPVKKNLVFAATNLTGQTSVGGVTEYIGETSSTNMTKSATTLYVLPNYDGTNYITDAQVEEFNDNGETSPASVTTANVADKTGYTLHVSYELIPEDGTAKTVVYDARVHVDAQFCKWQAGKAYTYIFKITNQTNGTTDPNAIDPAATTEPWIDPVDPRVPDDPALIPIVFDGVMVCDYDAQETGKQNDVDEWVITDPSSWRSIQLTTDHRYSPTPLTYTDYTEAIGTAWANAAADLPTPTFNSTNRTFTFAGDAATSFTWNASNQVKNTSVTPTYDIDGSETESVTGAAYTVYDYVIYVWNATANKADEYKAEVSTVTYGSKTVVETWDDISGNKYVKTSEYTASTAAATSTAWTKDGSTITDGEIATAESTIGSTPASSTVTTYSTPTVTYSSPVTKSTDKTPVKAYAIVKVNP